jgi:hypothetical protein
MKKEKTRDIDNRRLNETGSLAGSSGVAYQTSHRSPLSYNISPMTDLKFDTFASSSSSSAASLNAREIIERHNANVSSFYNQPILSSSNSKNSDDGGENNISSLYDELSNQLSFLMERIGGGGGGGGSEQEIEYEEDLSTIRGDTMSQIYYYGVTAILLYIFYRMLYKRRK